MCLLSLMLQFSVRSGTSSSEACADVGCWCCVGGGLGRGLVGVVESIWDIALVGVHFDAESWLLGVHFDAES